MLHVALGKLVRRRAEEVLQRQVGPGQGRRHAILELITETVGSACLGEARAGPDPAGERLVEEPAVHLQVRRRIRGRDLDHAQDVVPARDDLGEERLRIGLSDVANHAPRGIGERATHPGWRWRFARFVQVR